MIKDTLTAEQKYKLLNDAPMGATHYILNTYCKEEKGDMYTWNNTSNSWGLLFKGCSGVIQTYKSLADISKSL